jgi:hypothetical protein
MELMDLIRSRSESSTYRLEEACDLFEIRAALTKTKKVKKEKKLFKIGDAVVFVDGGPFKTGIRGIVSDEMFDPRSGYWRFFVNGAWCKTTDMVIVKKKSALNKAGSAIL